MVGEVIAIGAVRGPAATKDRILDAAEALFMEHGYEATSLRAITSAADANLAAVNYHFGSKEELFQAILTRRLDPMNQERVALLDTLEQATGVFLTGGNQLRISTIIGGTSAAKLIRTGNARGVHVAGTSAGASILSEHMIAFGKEGSSPRAGSVRLAPGLGLTNRFIIDQHFRQRDRLGRLTAALAYNPFAIGIGLDEDTAAFIGPDNTLEVEGSGAITVVDAGGMTFSSMADVRQTEGVCLLGLTVHILTAGATFNLHTRQASPGALSTEKS